MPGNVNCTGIILGSIDELCVLPPPLAGVGGGDWLSGKIHITSQRVTKQKCKPISAKNALF